MDNFLGKLRDFFVGDTERKPRSVDDVQLAAAALLVHAMRVDDVSGRVERVRVRDTLAARFDLSGAEVDTLIDAAREADDEAVDLYRFTRTLTANLDQPGRQEIVRMLWNVVAADGTIDEFEANLVWRVAELIGVSSADRIRLRQEVTGVAGPAEA
ncbi:MAG: TerB family tellurite resistance protein [Pseudomonadota bacterium]